MTCDCEPEPDEAAEALLRVACEVGIHGTRTLGPCPHSRGSTGILGPTIALLLAEGLAQLRQSCVVAHSIHRTYDSRREPRNDVLWSDDGW